MNEWEKRPTNSIISIIFYKVYFIENKILEIESNVSEEQKVTNPENNLIKNLKYEVKLDDQNQYTIWLNLSQNPRKRNLLLASV